MGWQQDRVRGHLTRAALTYGSAMGTSAPGQTPQAALGDAAGQIRNGPKADLISML